MGRLFKQNSFAKFISIDKMWDFALDPNDVGIKEKWYENFPEKKRKITVPSCWNMEVDLFRYTGTAWYKTTFETSASNIYINFEAVQNEADVYLDGKHLGNHYGGFLPFGFEVNNLSGQKHTLTVRVNNFVNMLDTYPLSRVDWFNYGGIARDVQIRELSSAFIKDYKISYEFKDSLKDVSLNIQTSIKTFAPVSENLEVYVNDQKFYSTPVSVNGEEELNISFDLHDIKLWGIYNPALYYVKLVFGNEDIIERIGFREIKTRGTDILLNGEKIKILGVNRHEEHPDFGFSMPFSLIKRDIDIIKNLNCNAIRTSHYPNSRETADYCDEIGMLFWTEVPAWNRSAEAMSNETALQRALKIEEEMIKEAFHHPSIIVLSMHNECATNTKEGYEVTKKMIELAKSLDSSKLVSYVSNKVGIFENKEICYSLADIVCLNHYIGWYFPAEDGDWNSFMEEYKQILKECDSLDKPFLMTEFGVAALMGTNTFESLRWSEDYQADCLEFTLNQLLNNDRISGTYIWQFCDNRSAVEFEISRPRGYNNKGILNEYRHPKRAYRTVQKIYGEHLKKVFPHYETLIFNYTKNAKMENAFKKD